MDKKEHIRRVLIVLAHFQDDAHSLDHKLRNTIYTTDAVLSALIIAQLVINVKSVFSFFSLGERDYTLDFFVINSFVS